MAKLTSQQARDGFADALNQVAFGGERLIIERRGKSVAALVSMADLEQLEAFEDASDLAYLKAQKEEPVVPWKNVKRELAEARRRRHGLYGGCARFGAKSPSCAPGPQCGADRSGHRRSRHESAPPRMKKNCEGHRQSGAFAWVTTASCIPSTIGNCS